MALYSIASATRAAIELFMWESCAQGGAANRTQRRLAGPQRIFDGQLRSHWAEIHDLERVAVTDRCELLAMRQGCARSRRAKRRGFATLRNRTAGEAHSNLMVAMVIKASPLLLTVALFLFNAPTFAYLMRQPLPRAVRQSSGRHRRPCCSRQIRRCQRDSRERL